VAVTCLNAVLVGFVCVKHEHVLAMDASYLRKLC
jgi:hypothetical protein